jgi:hypothetical protein
MQTEFLIILRKNRKLINPQRFNYGVLKGRGRVRADRPEYKVKLMTAMCFVDRNSFCEYYQNSSFLEHGGSPEKAVKLQMVFAI